MLQPCHPAAQKQRAAQQGRDLRENCQGALRRGQKTHKVHEISGKVALNVPHITLRNLCLSTEVKHFFFKFLYGAKSAEENVILLKFCNMKGIVGQIVFQNQIAVQFLIFFSIRY